MILKIKNLKFKFDVRLNGNDLDKVNQMVSILKAGGKLPPVVVNQNHEIVEGRKRVEAAKQAGLDEIDAQVKHFADSNAERLFAMNAQLGTAEPITEEDIRWNIRQLVRDKMPYDAILLSLSKTFPKSVAKRYIDDALSTLNKEKVTMAVNAVLNGTMSRSQVIEHFGVTKEQLVRAAGHRNQKIKKSQSLDTKARMGGSVGTLSKKVEAQGKNILQRLKDGFISHKEALEVINHTIALLRRVESRATEYGVRVHQAIELEKESE